MNIYLSVLTFLSLFSLGVDFYTVFCFDRGLKLVSPTNQIVAFKNILAAALYSVLPIKTLITILSSIAIALLLLLEIQVSIIWWVGLFLQLIYGVYYIAHISPLMRRFVQWDLKNPINKWDELYKKYSKGNSFLLILAVMTTIFLCTAFFMNNLLL